MRRIAKALRLCKRVVLYSIDRRLLANLVHVLVPRTEICVRREQQGLMISVAGQCYESCLMTYRPFAGLAPGLRSD